MPQKKSSRKKPKKKRQTKGRNNTPTLPANIRHLLIGAILCFLVVIIYHIHTTRILSFNSPPIVSSGVDNSENKPIGIAIHKINVRLPVAEARIRRGVWEIRKEGASHLAVSSAPGTNGSVIIYAHNTPQYFARLGELQVNDTIFVTTEKGDIYEYKVDEKHIVNPSQVGILSAPQEQEVLILYTCTGFADLKRLVIKATPLSATI